MKFGGLNVSDDEGRADLEAFSQAADSCLSTARAFLYRKARVQCDLCSHKQDSSSEETSSSFGLDWTQRP